MTIVNPAMARISGCHSWSKVGKSSGKIAKGIADTAKVNDLKIFGYFSIIKGVVESLMFIVGGVLSERISVSAAYLILSVYPILVLGFIFFYFKEEKVSRKEGVNSLGFIR